MNKYSDRPDYEINLAVARHLGHKPTLAGNTVEIWEEVRHGRIFTSENFDPCNNPADAMPIVIENRICMGYDVFAEERDGGNWVAQPAYGFSDERVRSDNYYRAAMICFLMMKDA